MRNCKWCGKEFDPGHCPNGKPRPTKLCPECRLKIVTPKPRICKECQRQFVPVHKHSRTYCDECLSKPGKSSDEYLKEIREKEQQKFQEREAQEALKRARLFNINNEIRSFREQGELWQAYGKEQFKIAKSIEMAIETAEANGVTVIEPYEGLFDTDEVGRRYFKCSSCHSWKRFKDSCLVEEGKLICVACLEDRKKAIYQPESI